MHDSSVAGPLLWPADEPWPVCTEVHQLFGEHLQSLAGIRRHRELLDHARPRRPSVGTRGFTADERAEIDHRIRSGYPLDQVDTAVPLLPVAQLYVRDTPGLDGPDGCDLLQVLWCPVRHGEEALSDVRLRWRRAGDVTAVSADPPTPFLSGTTNSFPSRALSPPSRSANTRHMPTMVDLDLDLDLGRVCGRQI